MQGDTRVQGSFSQPTVGVRVRVRVRVMVRINPRLNHVFVCGELRLSKGFKSKVQVLEVSPKATLPLCSSE